MKKLLLVLAFFAFYNSSFSQIIESTVVRNCSNGVVECTLIGENVLSPSEGYYLWYTVTWVTNVTYPFEVYNSVKSQNPFFTCANGPETGSYKNRVFCQKFSANDQLINVTASHTLGLPLPVTQAPTGTSIQWFCKGATLQNFTVNGSNIKWYSDVTGGSALLTSDTLTNDSIYYASQTVNGCESVNRLAVTAKIFDATSAPTGLATQNFCAGTLANIQVSGSNIKWYAAATGGNPLSTSTSLVNGASYFASQTVNGCESKSRLAVNITLSNIAAPSGQATQTVCVGSTIADLQATGSNIKWHTAAGGGSALASNVALTNGTSYYASQTVNGCEGSTRLQVTVTIGNVAAPTGTSSVSICGNATVADLTATGSNIQWYAAASGGTALASSTSLTTSTTYYASQTVSGCESVNRLAKTVTLLTAPQAPTGSANQSFCYGATIANLVATGSNLKWYSTATGGSYIYSFTPLVNNTVYYASQTLGSCESSNRLAVTVTFTGPAAPTGSATQTLCPGSIVGNLTATGTGIKWYTTSSGGTALNTINTLANGATYYASQTVSTCESASRLAVSVNLTGTAAPTGSANQTFCSTGATVFNLQATGSNIKWYSAVSGGTALSTGALLVNGNTYYASQTINSCESVNRLAVLVSLSGTAAPTGSANQSHCNGSTIANLVATGSNIKWYGTASGGTPLNTSNTLYQGFVYYASQTVNGCESTNRLAVTVNLINGPAAPTGNTVQTFCSASTISSLVATGTNIQWYAAATGGAPLLTTVPLVNNTSYYASQNNGTCESSNRLAVLVNIGAAAPTGAANQTVCAGSKLQDLMVSGANIKWYTSSWPITLLSATTSIVSGSTYTATQSIGGCESSGLNITAIFGSIATPTGSATQNFSSGATVANLAANGNNIKWYSSPTGGTALSTSAALVNGNVYYASQTVGSCESIGRLAVTANVSSCNAPSGASNQSLCTGSTIANLLVTGSNIKWYNSAIGGSLYNTSTALVNGQTYYASQTVNTCESNRLAVTVSLSATAKPTVNNMAQYFCNGAKVSDLQVTGSNIKWYLNNTGTAVNPQSLLSSDFYYASQTVNGCESTDREMVLANVGAAVTAPQGAANQTFTCGEVVGSIVTSASNVKWYNNATGGTALANNTSLVDGTTYYAAATEKVWLNTNECESTTRLAVTVKVNAAEYIDNHTWCGNFVWSADGKTYTSSNTSASVTIPNGSYLGCDSIVKLNLNLKTIDATVTMANGYDLVAQEQNASSYIWSDCNNGTIFLDQPFQNFTPPYDGNFRVSIALGACSAQSSCTTVISTGIDQNISSTVLAFPTITNDEVFIKSSNDFVGSQYLLTDEIGKTISQGVISNETTSIHLESFEEGIYFIRINKNAQVFKVIKRNTF